MPALFPAFVGAHLLMLASASGVDLGLQATQNPSECFFAENNHWIFGHTREFFSTPTVEACLKECLMARTKRNFLCLSALYYPSDKDCSLLQQNRATVPKLYEDTKNKTFDVNYYENVCANPVGYEDVKIRVQALVEVKSGPQGYLQFVQHSPSERVEVSGFFENLPLGITTLSSYSLNAKAETCSSSTLDPLTNLPSTPDYKFGTWPVTNGSSIIIISPQTVDLKPRDLIGQTLVLSREDDNYFANPALNNVTIPLNGLPISPVVQNVYRRNYACGMFERKGNFSDSGAFSLKSSVASIVVSSFFLLVPVVGCISLS